MTDRCLHCALRETVEAHAREHAPTHETAGVPVVQMHEVLGALAQVVGEYVAMIPGDEKRRESFNFFAALAASACVQSLATEHDAGPRHGLH